MVGAGAAGITSAYFLAKAGIEVLLLERGLYPGAKNISGGAVYSLPTRELIPDFWREAPVERVLVDQQYWLMTETSAVKIGFTSDEMDKPPYNKFSVLRATFDRWYADRAVAAGVALITGCKAEALLLENRRVIGVQVSGSRRGNIYADVVILAQGVNPLLAEKAGLIAKPKAKNYSLYVKEMIALPEQVINERFHVSGNRGAVIGLLGDNSAGLIGTGSIYTFKEYVGVNLGVGVKTLAEKKVNLVELLGRLKRHPVVHPLIRDGTTVELLAHMIPEGGYNAVPRLVFDGMLVTGDAAGLVNGTHGLNLAMYSGKFAADTVIKAAKKGDFSSGALQTYSHKLEDSFVLKDMKDNRRVPGFYSSNPTVFADYIGLLNKVAAEVATVYPISRRKKRRLIRDTVLESKPVGKLLIDAFNAGRVVK